MRKTLVVAITVVFAMGIGIISRSTQTDGRKANHLVLSNLEALSYDNELPRFPCISAPSEECRYEALDAQNNKVTLKAMGYKNA